MPGLLSNGIITPAATTGVRTATTPSAAAGNPAACAAASDSAQAASATAPEAAREVAVASGAGSSVPFLDSASRFCAPALAGATGAPPALLPGWGAGGPSPRAGAHLGSHAGHSAGSEQQAMMKRAIAALSTAIPATRRPRPASAVAAPEPRPRTAATDAKFKLRGRRHQEDGDRRLDNVSTGGARPAAKCGRIRYIGNLSAPSADVRGAEAGCELPPRRAHGRPRNVEGNDRGCERADRSARERLGGDTVSSIASAGRLDDGTGCVAEPGRWAWRVSAPGHWFGCWRKSYASRPGA